MIIVKKPFMYLRDVYLWKYQNFRGYWRFTDLNRFMILERKERMACEIFLTKEKKSSKDAEYIVITLEDFLQHSEIIDDILSSQYNLEAHWNFIFVKLGIKLIRNAEIVIPTKEVFPLIIRNEKLNFYIAEMSKKRC